GQGTDSSRDDPPYPHPGYWIAAAQTGLGAKSGLIGQTGSGSCCRARRAGPSFAEAGGSMPIRRILWGALAVAILDIADAALFYGVSPLRCLRGVAAGLVGRPAAVSGGLPASLLGAVLHL